MTTSQKANQITVTAPIGDLEALERALVAAREANARYRDRVTLTVPVAALEQLDDCLIEYRAYRRRIIEADEAGDTARVRSLEEGEIHQLDRIVDAVAAFLDGHRKR